MLNGKGCQLRIGHEIARNLNLFAQSCLNPGRVIGRGWDSHHWYREPIDDISPRVGTGQRGPDDSWVGDDSEACTDRLPGQAHAAIAGERSLQPRGSCAVMDAALVGGIQEQVCVNDHRREDPERRRRPRRQPSGRFTRSDACTRPSRMPVLQGRLTGGCLTAPSLARTGSLTDVKLLREDSIVDSNLTLTAAAGAPRWRRRELRR